MRYRAVMSTASSMLVMYSRSNAGMASDGDGEDSRDGASSSSIDVAWVSMAAGSAASSTTESMTAATGTGSVRSRSTPYQSGSISSRPPFARRLIQAAEPTSYSLRRAFGSVAIPRSGRGSSFAPIASTSASPPRSDTSSIATPQQRPDSITSFIGPAIWRRRASRSGLLATQSRCQPTRWSSKSLA